MEKFSKVKKPYQLYAPACKMKIHAAFKDSKVKK